MKKMLVLILLFWGAVAAAQHEASVQAALYLTGADSPEELDERLLEELESYRSRPLPINRVSRSRLLESGLLSPYQVAALEEYRSLSGDVLSFAELERVDGFGKEAVRVLRPFLSLDSGRRPGEAVKDTLVFRHAAVVRAKPDAFSAKYRLTAGRFEAGGAWNGAIHALWRTRRGKVVLGDYQLRFGQGLAFWSAFRLSGLSTPESFSQKANGLTPSWSFNRSGTYRGLAWDACFGPLQVGLFGALDGTVGARAGWLGRRGQAGVTATLDRFSLDGRYNWKGVDLFGEAALKGKAPAGVAGALFPVGERWKAALQLRAVPSAFSGRKYGEYALAAGAGYRSDDRSLTASWATDASLLPIPDKDPLRCMVKSVGLISWQSSPCWKWEGRFVSRIRSDDNPRTELRLDATWNKGVWTVRERLHGVYAGGPGVLAYVEGGWKPEKGFVWLRATGFSAASWAARIYSYERDAPGNFTVPAYYGLGCSVSAYGGWHLRFRKTRVKLYLRASYLWKKEKPGQAGLKVQMKVDR